MILRVKDHPLDLTLSTVKKSPYLVTVCISWVDPETINRAKNQFIGWGFSLLEATKHALDRASAPDDIRAAIIKELNEHDHNRK